MTWNAQSNAEGRVEQTLLGACTSNEFFPKNLEGDFVVVGVKVDGFAVAASCVALLAGVIISQVYGVTPSQVRLGLSQYLVLLGYAALPMCGLRSDSALPPFDLKNQVLLGFEVMKRGVLGYADGRGMHVSANGDRLSASTLAEVFALVFRNPHVNASVIGATVVAGIRLVFNSPCHVTQYIKVNEGFLANGMNCWNPDRQDELPDEGNQQPSREYTCGRFNDYRSGTDRLITG